MLHKVKQDTYIIIRLSNQLRQRRVWHCLIKSGRQRDASLCIPEALVGLTRCDILQLSAEAILRLASAEAIRRWAVYQIRIEEAIARVFLDLDCLGLGT